MGRGGRAQNMLTLEECKTACSPDPDCEGVAFLAEYDMGSHLAAECYTLYHIKNSATPCTHQGCVREDCLRCCHLARSVCLSRT